MYVHASATILSETKDQRCQILWLLYCGEKDAHACTCNVNSAKPTFSSIVHVRGAVFELIAFLLHTPRWCHMPVRTFQRSSTKMDHLFIVTQSLANYGLL